METKIEKLEDSKIKAQVTADAKEVDNYLDKTYKQFARQYSFPGFRKGKAPRPVLDNALGREAILAAATEDLVNALYPQVIEQEKLFPVGNPEFTDASVVDPGKPFEFAFTISVKPEIELSSYDPVEIEIPFKEATPAEIDAQIENITSHYKTYKDAAASAKLSKDNAAAIDMKATNEAGEEVASLTSNGLTYTLGNGLYSEAFDKEVTGIKKGETRTFALDVPADETAILMTGVAGQKVNFEVVCNGIKTAAIPELTDEWVKETLGLESAEELRNELKESIEQQKEQVIPQIKENAAALKLVERVKGDVPPAMAEQIESELLQDFFTQLQRYSLTLDAYLAQSGIDNDQFKQDIKRQAEDEAKRALALDAWARKKGFDVTEEDITLEFERSGAEDPKKLQREWMESGRLYMIREGMLRSKAMADVLETAKVKEIDFAEREEKEAKKSKSTKKAK